MGTITRDIETPHSSALALAEAYINVMATDQAKIQAVVDRHGLNTVIELLEEICATRAKHAHASGQTAKSASWYRAAVALDKAKGMAPHE
jgi:hypothetical protein